MHRKLFVSMIMVAVFALVAQAGPHTHFAYLNGIQENPPTGSAGTGLARFELVGDDLYYSISFGGLAGALTNGHIHTGVVGVNGGVIHPLQNLTATGANGVWNDLTAAQIGTLNTHGFYVNIHSNTYPGGDIRGQILNRGTKIANMTGSQEVPPNAATAVGFGWFDLNSTSTALDYAIKWSNFTGPVTAAHIHRAVAGVAGGVVHGLMNVSNTGAFGSWALTAQNVIQLEAESLYVNAHTAAFPGGETRGQIICVCVPDDANFDALADAGTSQCIALCPDRSSRIRVFNIPEGLFPVVTKRLGCSNPCDVDCDPATYIQEFFGGNWQYTNGVFWLEVRGDGCICVTFDDILPVELNGFDAVAGDGEVALNWSTASESSLDKFEIVRNGATMASIPAQNASSGAEYTWVDNSVSNGTTYNYTLVVVNLDGTREELATQSATPQAGQAVVTDYALHQNYPNPFNPETNIAFDLADAANVTLKVFNVNGQEIATLASGSFAAGRHVVSFDGSALASGVYLYRLEANGFSAQQKMVLLK